MLWNFSVDSINLNILSNCNQTPISFALREKVDFNGNLGEEGWSILPACCFSLINSEMVKAVTLPFCSIQPLFILTLAPDSRYCANLRREYFRFPYYWSFPYKENCHNSRTSDNIDMKLGPVTKLGKRNKTTVKKT